MQVEVVSVDLESEASWDFRQPGVFGTLLKLAENGDIDIILGGPPCGTWSLARHNKNFRGPRPVRRRGRSAELLRARVHMLRHDGHELERLLWLREARCAERLQLREDARSLHVADGRSGVDDGVRLRLGTERRDRIVHGARVRNLQDAIAAFERRIDFVGGGDRDPTQSGELLRRCAFAARRVHLPQKIAHIACGHVQRCALVCVLGTGIGALA